MVKVRYEEPFKTSIGKLEERIKAETLGELITRLEEKYKENEHVSNMTRYAMIFLNNETLLSKNNLEFKLKPKDEILILQICY